MTEVCTLRCGLFFVYFATSDVISDNGKCTQIYHTMLWGVFSWWCYLKRGVNTPGAGASIPIYRWRQMRQGQFLEGFYLICYFIKSVTNFNKNPYNNCCQMSFFPLRIHQN